MNIAGNKQADQIAKMAIALLPCKWASTNLTWLKAYGKRKVVSELRKKPNSEKAAIKWPKATAKLTYKQATAISSLQAGRTLADPKIPGVTTTCPCGETQSSKHTFMTGARWKNRNRLLDKHIGPLALNSITRNTSHQKHS